MNLPAASYSLKVLVSNVFAGCLIGSRGSSIKELIEVSGANVQVSGIKDTYPGTQDRIVLIMGSSSAINLAMSLVLELAAASNSLSPTAMRDWSPQEIVNHLGNYDAVNFAIKVTIPSSVGGAIIGKEGSTLRSMCEASGAKAVLSSKEDSIFTQERILTISGTTHEIRAFVELLLQKMTSEPETAQYVNSGTRYFANNAFHASKKGRDRPHTPRNPSEQDKASGVVTSEIVITMQIAESLIGQILGKKVRSSNPFFLTSFPCYCYCFFKIVSVLLLLIYIFFIRDLCSEKFRVYLVPKLQFLLVKITQLPMP